MAGSKGFSHFQFIRIEFLIHINFSEMKNFYLTFLAIFCLTSGFSQKYEKLAMTPPMGWNSWNRFECEINEQVVRDAADAMVSSGMKEAGYEFIVIDDYFKPGNSQSRCGSFQAKIEVILRYP